MKIADLMTPHPVTCSPGTNLAEAAELMLRADCGILPIELDGKLQGVVTDRDLFIALGTRDLRPSAMSVADVVRGPVYSCGPEDDVAAVLDIMRRHAVRRVPVEGFGGRVIGIVSINDIVLAMGAKKAARGAEVMETLQTICAHHHPEPHIDAA